MLDYAHNPSAYESILDLVKRMGHKRRIVVFDMMGDRRDEDIHKMCGMIARHCDQAVAYEDVDLRGRAGGELMDLSEQALIQAGLDTQHIDKIPNEEDAINHALSIAGKGDLVCIMSGRVEQVIQHLYGMKENTEPT